MTAQAVPRAASIPLYEEVPEFAALGVRAFTTTRAAGSFGLSSNEPVRDVMDRWNTVSIADCVPVFLAHASGAIALLHSGWRGTAARIIDRALDLLATRGIPSGELQMHLGPAICGGCYEVSADVVERLTGRQVAGPTTVDLRAIIADHARVRGVRRITASPNCTRCNNDQFFSHRAGDAGRQLGVMIAAL